MAESVSMAWDSTHGETVMRGEWKACRVCGYPTNLGPVCRDLRCEIEHYERQDSPVGTDALEPPTDEACPDCRAEAGEPCHIDCSSRWT